MANTVRRRPTPEHCGTFAEVCAEIDRIDRNLIKLLAQRRRYFDRAVALHAQNEPAGSGMDRLFTVLRTRRDWARRAGVDPRSVELFYTLLTHQAVVDRFEGGSERVLLSR
jgi:isochorismate pyruvate lyase